MGNFKGTNGNWYTEEYHDHKYKQAAIKINSDGIESFITVWSGNNEICEQTKADAQLIACAPEMLDLLQECLDTFECKDSEDRALKGKIEELITKATTS